MAKKKKKHRKANTTKGVVGAYGTQGAAHYLSISIPSLRRLVLRGLIRPSRGLRTLSFAKFELDAYLERTMVE